MKKDGHMNHRLKQSERNKETTNFKGESLHKLKMTAYTVEIRFSRTTK